MCILIMNHLVLFCFVFILMGKTEVFFFFGQIASSSGKSPGPGAGDLTVALVLH